MNKLQYFEKNKNVPLDCGEKLLKKVEKNCKTHNLNAVIGTTFNTDSFYENTNPIQHKCDNVEISWYKYLGRDTTINEEYDVEFLVNIFNNDLGTFRKLTSLIFEYLCIDAGIREHKAHIMAEAVDMFQRFLPSWSRRSFNKYKEEMGF